MYAQHIIPPDYHTFYESPAVSNSEQVKNEYEMEISATHEQLNSECLSNKTRSESSFSKLTNFHCLHSTVKLAKFVNRTFYDWRSNGQFVNC